MYHCNEWFLRGNEWFLRGIEEGADLILLIRGTRDRTANIREHDQKWRYRRKQTGQVLRRDLR